MTDLTSRGLNVTRTQNHFYQFAASGLRPNTKHNVFIEDEDVGFRTRQFGKEFGADLISNENGELFFGILHEIEFARNRNFELPQGQTLSFQDSQVNNTAGSRQASQTVKNNLIVELISPDGQSQTQIVMNLNIILTAGPVNQLFPIE